MTKPLFNWLDRRAAGVLLHPTALPGIYGIGTLNDHALRFIDFLAESGMSYWQTCPLGPTGYGNSPYQSFSSFAGNPYLISLRELNAKDLLDAKILEELTILPNSFVDFGGLYLSKWPVLEAVYHSFVNAEDKPLPYGSFEAFKAKHADWLEPFAYFQALKAKHDGACWTDWPDTVQSFEKAKSQPQLRRELEAAIDAQKFFQYLFFGQWSKIREYARERGVQIIGDIPIFVALDSADVWENPAHYQFDLKKRQPQAVAGCPPDYFSADGQLWGNPLYDWDAMKADGYGWWIRRLKASFELCDVVRIDHFRGFEAYWRIPYGSPTARTGVWTPGPGLDFFKAIKKAVPGCKLIAEDLGELTDSVHELRAATGLPGMSVLQFAFGATAENPYLPHNLHHDTVLYPGTHDNDTALGWYAKTDEKTRDHARRYFDVSGEAIGWDLIRASYRSTADLIVIPFQDILSLGSEARFNSPGKATGNWEWRYLPEQLEGLFDGTAPYLKSLGELFGRVTQPTVD